MMTAAQCDQFAGQYRSLSQAGGISKDREFVLKNIARSFKGLASQLDRLAALARDEASQAASIVGPR
ncbi:hypothetical protein H8A95_03935 [Bradyrhizobium sp. Pear76]|uniref:hypothetical protein n=1 Tax=Bradyrhizobium oropedii TaxID=1571201 RepID=UPI001E3F3064|nr:hypothetical protein [Bradyrhizobium oropedii]MCC8961490.1 hypothetical protein [Bradyrhizobium oropedii]